MIIQKHLKTKYIMFFVLIYLGVATGRDGRPITRLMQYYGIVVKDVLYL